MDKPGMISEVWNWLPVFRVIAETQHLPTASEKLSVSSSSLSRTLGLLEFHLGVDLFVREGRSICLNHKGQELLIAVRNAMRIVDDGLSQVKEDPFGALRIYSSDSVTQLVALPALRSIGQTNPELKLLMRTSHNEPIDRSLLDNSIDIAITETPVYSDQLEVKKAFEISRSVYCSPDHPLCDSKRVSVSDIECHPFVATVDEFGVTTDGWPMERKRSIGVEVDCQSALLDICAQGKFLAVLPDLLASELSDRVVLHKVRYKIPMKSTCYVIHRKYQTTPDLIENFTQLISCRSG